jgi:outer membrane protein
MHAMTSPSATLTLAAASLAAILAASPAQAEGWQGGIGATAAFAPEYLGSDDYEFRPLPAVNLNYGELLSINLREGIAWHALRLGNWTASPFIGYTFGRDDEGDLSRFEEVDGGATMGLRVSYRQGIWRYNLEGFSAVTGDVEGATFLADATMRLSLSERTTFALTPNVSYSNRSWAESYFGVSARDSARSGVRAYRPDDGYWRAGLNAALSYDLGPKWTATGFIGTSYLTGDAADSPIVDELGSQWQAIGGVSLTYRLF